MPFPVPFFQRDEIIQDNNFTSGLENLSSTQDPVFKVILTYRFNLIPNNNTGLQWTIKLINLHNQLFFKQTNQTERLYLNNKLYCRNKSANTVNFKALPHPQTTNNKNPNQHLNFKHL